MSTTFTSGVEASLAPWLTPQADPQGALANLTVASASMFEQVFGLVADQGSPDVPGTFTAGWSTLLDPAAAPTWALPYLAQFVGVQVPPNTPDAEARAIIKAESGQQRGTPASIVSAVQRNLTGSKSCILLERTPSAYAFQVVVRPEQIATSAAAIEAAVDAVRPAGLTWQLIATDGEIWNQAARAWTADTTTWSAKG